MSKNGFDELLLKKLQEEELEYDPAHWDRLSRLLPPVLAPTASHGFDESLLEKLQEEELEYNPAHWDRLSQLLPPALAPAASRRKKWGFAAGIAATVALVLTAALVIKMIYPGTKAIAPGKQETAVVTKPSAATATEQLNDPAAAEPAVTQTETDHNAGTPDRHRNNAALTPFQGNPANTPADVLQQSILPPGSNQPAEPVVADKQEEPAPNIIKEEKINHAAQSPILKKEEKVPANLAYLPPALDPFENSFSKADKKSKTSIAFAGGVNYGTLNAGYTVGLSARRKIAGDFFVDGSVAMMYNNNANNVVNNSGPSAGENSNLAARPAPGQMAVNSPALEPTQHLYYVQFNPSLGYQIEKHVALSVGGDFQQMIRTDDGQEKVQLVSNTAKIFPTFDVGLTTKTEFSITPNIQAGLLYREGLNNLLKNDGGKYVNRRYIQVQFKYNIPVN